jgi:hypothetical protein
MDLVKNVKMSIENIYVFKNSYGGFRLLPGIVS